tara:strand:- start:74 stop:700 length:627 start_codon:yes stop_codon:yes gene_type:complete
VEVEKLKHFRFIIPAFIGILSYWYLGKITNQWEYILPNKLQDFIYAPICLIIAYPYSLLNLTFVSNQPWFDEVNENLRKSMLDISGIPDEPDIYTWTKLRGIFYDLVDNDESLKTKAKLAYSNGLRWTTCADLRVISFLFIVISTIVYILGAQDAWIATTTFSAIWFLSFFASDMVTKKHKNIGIQQIEIINQKYKNKLIEKLEAVKN